MAERRTNYTGKEHNELIRRTKKEEENRTAQEITPMMLLQEIARFSRCMLEKEVPTQSMQNSSRQILRALGRKGGLCQLDLAKLTHLKPPTISVALQKMENEGLVTRVIDEKDGRATRVYLTDVGNSINEKVAERIRIIEDAAMSNVTDEENKALSSALLKIRENLIAFAESEK